MGGIALGLLVLVWKKNINGKKVSMYRDPITNLFYRLERAPNAILPRMTIHRKPDPSDQPNHDDNDDDDKDNNPLVPLVGILTSELLNELNEKERKEVEKAIEKEVKKQMKERGIKEINE